MAISRTDAPAYTDLSALTALKRGAASKDPGAIREVARQFESMFTRMMLKSMRDATGPDPMFGDEQQQMYQGMFDDQLSIQLSRGKGLGLADMLIRQLQKMGVPGAAHAADDQAGAPGSATALPAAAISTNRAGATAYTATQSASQADQQKFVREVWPQAQQAGEQLGVDPRSLIAQAALETNWGRSLPQDASGDSSNNLFGMKASRGWAGPSVTAATQEYQGSVATDTTAQFRSYANAAQSFQDYVALLQNNPRYSAALNTGGDVQAFASALQRGGYATDPEYVRKIGAIAQHVSVAQAAAGVTDLKSPVMQPITPNVDASRGAPPGSEE
jgi:peptidoglycan hydrolase FlgJ